MAFLQVNTPIQLSYGSKNKSILTQAEDNLSSANIYKEVIISGTTKSEYSPPSQKQKANDYCFCAYSCYSFPFGFVFLLPCSKL